MTEALREVHLVADSQERVVGENLWPGLRRHNLSIVGLTDGGYGYEMQRLRPTAGHLLICYGGSGEVWVDGGWQPCGNGQAYIAPPLIPMGFRTVGRKRWQFGWVFLPVVDGQPPPITSKNPVLISIDPRPIVQAIEGLYLESAGSAHIDRLNLWGDLVSAYARDIARGCKEVDPLWQLWAEVDTRLSEPWTLDRLADRAGLMPESLRRQTLRTVGRSPMRQVTHLRMRRAEALLRSTHDKLFNIAAQVGYENPFAFSTAFRRWKGQSPKEFRSEE